MQDRTDSHRFRHIEEQDAAKDKRAMSPPPATQHSATWPPRSGGPSISSTSFREPAAIARSVLALRDGGERCWVCGKTFTGIEVAHHVSEDEVDADRFRQYQKAPFNLLVETTHPTHRLNLILLCTNHHARSQLYRIHILDIESMGVTSSDNCCAARHWGGNPLTVILKAMLGAFPISTAMPTAIKQKLLQPLDLYGHAPPPARKVVHHDHSNAEDDELSSCLAPTLFSGTVPARKRGPSAPETRLKCV
ncbi:hypothetical protein FN846DRAFT_909968 [Sphaerosporella brunnea]|uniref:Uncharacterized protein n=1 Tax=Sphaerosporella brunnea TaxID=1250544 RepID=A0A5J5ENI5_9PEZI|nr:hypothetical protein FN846DRAFT_909968 [Sphaerosporella brunnea]